jgi:hypothetical protein
MKTIRWHYVKTLGIFCAGLVVAIAALTAWSQTAPFLTITPLGTNQFALTISNSVPGNYELWWTPVLADPAYPWTVATVGTNGQTFNLNMTVFQSGFFRALLDTNAIPLWEAADPNNPGAGILSVWIDSPANGATLN